MQAPRSSRGGADHVAASPPAVRTAAAADRVLMETPLTVPVGISQRSLVLPWAIAASVALHGGLLVARFGGMDSGPPVAAAPILQATLQPAPPTTEDLPTVAVVAVAETSATLPPPAAGETPPAPPPGRPAKVLGTSTPPGDGITVTRISAQPLVDRNRLGDLYARQLVEFPIEVDRPARMVEPIVARYPKTALAQGQEDSVGVWVVVSVDGTAEEVQVVDGSPEFAAEVVTAINAAKFEPAENRHYRIRFPIALEFQFRANATGAAVATAKAN